MKFKSKANNNCDLAAGTVTVNNVFVHWIRELNIVRYGDERPILPTINTVNVYRYLDELLKYMPKEDLTKMENNLIYCTGKVILADGPDRRANNVANAVDAPKRTDATLTKRIEKFPDQLKNGCIYRIPLKFLCSLGLVKQCVKFNTKFTLMLETEVNKLCETNVNDANPLVTVDADIVLTSAPYVQYEQIELDPNFRAHLEITLTANSFLRTGIQKTPYQKTFEINVGSQSHVIDFMGANKQF